MTLEGRGLSERASGRGGRFFVPYSAAGDLVKASALETGDNIFDARIMELLRTGPGRTHPKCPLYYRPGGQRWCGGCDFQHLNYETQLKAKQEIALDCLGKTPSLRGVHLDAVQRSPEQWRYRNKLQVPFRRNLGKTTAGFFHPGTHDVVNCEDCPVQNELSTAILREVKKIADAQGWSVYDEDLHRGWLRHLLVRTTRSGAAMVTLVANGEPRFNIQPALSRLAEEFPQIKSLYLNIQTEQTSVILGRSWQRLVGEAQLEETICGKRFLFYPGSFLQVNTPAAEALYLAAASFLDMGERTSELYDLYCGVGTIGLTVGAKFKRVIGIEENAGAAACAWKNAQRNKIRNVKFIAARAEDVLAKELHGTLRQTASVVVDPPRSGCAKSLLEKFRHPMVRKVVYVSCNPETFMRDADFLVHSGYILKKLKPADLFPQTSHVELLGFFERAHKS